MQTWTELQQALDEQLQPLTEFGQKLNNSTQALAQAIESVTRYERQSKAVQLVAALFDALAGGFIGVSILLFIQGNYSAAFGFLGPAAASVVGAISFRLRRILVGR